MFRWLENLVDPFAATGLEQPPTNPWSFVVRCIRPTRYVLTASVGLSLVGSSLEVWLIYYSSQLITVLAGADPAGERRS